MGALCGKASSDDETARAPQQSVQLQQQQQQQQQQQDKQQQDAHAANGVSSAANGDDDAPAGGSGLQPSAAAAAASTPIDEGDVKVAVIGGSDPDFRDQEAAAQSNGDEALSYWDRNKTFKPQRQLPAGSKASHLQHTMQATMKATLGGGELQNTVKLPEGEDLNEWIAVNSQWRTRFPFFVLFFSFCFAKSLRGPRMHAR